jgi:hypothetical protein
METMMEEKLAKREILVVSTIGGDFEAERFFMNALFGSAFSLTIGAAALQAVRVWREAIKERNALILEPEEGLHGLQDHLRAAEEQKGVSFEFVYSVGDGRAVVPNTGLRIFLDLLVERSKAFSWVSQYGALAAHVVRGLPDGGFQVSKERTVFLQRVDPEKGILESPVFLMPPEFHLIDLSHFKLSVAESRAGFRTGPQVLTAQWIPASPAEVAWAQPVGWHAYAMMWSDLLNILERTGALTRVESPC